MVSHTDPTFGSKPAKAVGIPISCLATKKGTFPTAVSAHQYIGPHSKLEKRTHLG